VYDALLILGFGGPEGPDEVMPFLENVTRGRGIPRERLIEVGTHYAHFGGVSPINGQLRALKAAVEADFAAHHVPLRVYWGNRNWRPMLADTVRAMKDDGVEHALALATSAFGSYSGCRQYREDLERAAIEGMTIEKLPPFFDHPSFVDAVVARVNEASARDARLVFTAHSIPSAQAASSPYESQFRAIAEIVAQRCGFAAHDLVFQSRSGPPDVAWLGPDVHDHVEALADWGVKKVLLVPLGFVSDHMEVVWDLDHEAKRRAEALGVTLLRAATVGTHEKMITMVRELVLEKLTGPTLERLTTLGARRCGVGCCEAPRRRGS
jgi:ferrochelatase